VNWSAMTALAVVAIALLLAAPAIGSFFLLREIQRTTAALHRLILMLEQDMGPALTAARSTFEDAGKAVAAVRREIESFADTSRDLRGRVLRAAAATQDRLQDLGAVLDVLHEEVEDAALDLATTLRTARGGMSLFSSVRRALFGRRRRRR